MAKMDQELIKLMEDELQGMLETRQGLDIGGKEYTLLTNAIDKCENKLNTIYKDMNDSENAKAKIESEAELKKAELEMRKEELNMKAQQFKQDMEMRKEELAQKEKSDKNRNIWTFTGIAVGSLVTLVTAVWTQQRGFDHQDHWIPQLMYFEKNDSFSYSAAKAMERAVLK